MKIGTWNVNGIRKRFPEVVAWVAEEKPDVFCLQEIKATADQVPDALIGLADYFNYWHGGAKGYSGVSLHVRRELCPKMPPFAHPAFDMEARIVSAELPGDRIVASVYVPNGNKDYAAKVTFLKAMRVWVAEALAAGKELLYCGDLNVARELRDVHPKLQKITQIGQTPEEREMLEAFLGEGLTDLGRALHPNEDELFTWWAPWRDQRKRNIGWRLDYVCASKGFASRVQACEVRREYGSSDHAPVVAVFGDE